MPVIAVRKSGWDAGNDSQKWAMRLAARKVELGQPALYQQPNGTEWLIAHDSRVSLLDVAILGTVAAGLTAFPNWTVPADKEVARQQVFDFVKDNIVLPRDVALTDGNGDRLGDPYRLVIEAQGAPSWVAARESLPNGLSPVEVTP